MHPRTFVRRRPSASLIVSFIALFVALGGAGYAATQLPAGSVGTDQIRDNAVTFKKINPNSVGAVRLANGGVVNSKLANNSVSYKKIQAGAVGRVRANLDQLQARIGNSCTSTNQAIVSIDKTGKASCATAPPAEFGATTTAPVAVTDPTHATSIVSKSLPGGSSYLAVANPLVKVTGATAGQHVTVTCALAVGPATTATQTASVTFDIPTGAPDQTASIPLQVAAASSTTAITGSVSCTRTVANPATPAPTVTVAGALNVIQTQSNS
jgi:hypothetical protein